MRKSDVRTASVHAITTRPDGQRVATVRMRAAAYRPDRWWSFCDLPVALPEGFGELFVGDEVELVLASVADAARVADGPGHYSCRVNPANEAPVLPPDRSTDGVFGGLVERSEPPASGALIVHLGSGLTCYPELTGEGPFPPEALVHGEWSEFILGEPHRTLQFAKVARGA